MIHVACNPVLRCSNMYDLRPMSNQRSNKKTHQVLYVFKFRLKLELEILNCQALSSVLSCTTNILHLPDSIK